MPITTTMPRIVTGCEPVRAQRPTTATQNTSLSAYDNILHFPSGVPATDGHAVALASLLRKARSAHPTNVHLCRSTAAPLELHRDSDALTSAYLL